MNWKLLKKIWDLIRGKKDPVNPQPDTLPDAINPDEIKWLGENVGKWDKKYSLKVSLTTSKIIYDQEGTSNWTPKKKSGGGDNLVGNPWVIAKINGQWTAATHEWMRPKQKEKGKHTVDYSHIKLPNYFPPPWTPSIGEEYGFLVSGLCRCPVRNQLERTQIIKLVWK